MSNSIRQNEWRDLIKTFWDEHRGSRVTIDGKDADGCRLVSVERQLKAISVERSGQDIVLKITVGHLRGADQVRTIINPVTIAYIPDREYRHESLRIEESDGTETLLTVDSPEHVIDDYPIKGIGSSFSNTPSTAAVARARL